MTKYYAIEGQFHRIYYHPSKDSKKFLLNTLQSHALKWKIARFLIKLNILPFKKVELAEKGDLILIGYRKKIFNFSKMRVYTSAFDEKGQKDIENEVKIKKEIKNLGIHTPKVISYDNGVLTEELVITKLPKIRDLKESLTKLHAFYMNNGIEESTFQEEVRKINLGRLENNPAIRKAKKLLENDKKCYMTRIHGDFHSGNIGVDTDNLVWIFDWGSSRRDTILGDLVWMELHDKISMANHDETFCMHYILSLLLIIKREMNLNNKASIIEDAIRKLQEKIQEMRS